MMKNYLILFLIILMVSNSNSQTTCVQDSIDVNIESKLAPTKSTVYPAYTFCVKIYVHVIRKSNGTGGQSVADVNQALSYLHTSFNPYDIFFAWDNMIDYIDDDTKFLNPSSTIYSINNHSDGVDIYMFDDSIGYINKTGAGSSDQVQTALWVTGYFEDDVNVAFPLVRSHVLSHEMGHVLSLWHTHHGTGENTPDPFECDELVNGSNSDICGDYIEDTPADPNMEYDVDLSDCTWLDSGVDINGDPYVPDEENIMSYSQPKCLQVFTPLQSERMQNALINITYLQDVSSYSTNSNICAQRNPTLDYYPNTTNEELNLDLREKPAGTYTYELYDYMGVLVLSGESQNVLKTIDTAALEEGTYFLHFYDTEEVIVKHIVIEH